ncbi:DinB family protein [Pseudalkalibacillus caeni]|uniref:Damage-inducible protein DinB n=1 Tax=Exobacillus caeni TaxID=2574798 RepID=A0A5R9F7P6_9BACL|nr:DinB family protein [Pseudalkalibacillus caeni]TLS36534.1 damage-inducible protein DinB [Pseudalkalibacillus caeni]
MKKHHVLQLYDYHVWANNKFFERLKELPEEMYDREIQSVFPSIRQALVHIYTTDTLWLGVMQECSMEEIQASIVQVQGKTKDKSLEEIETVYAKLADLYKAFFNSQEDLDKPIAPEHPTFGRLETRLSELVQHVVNHGTYHRGNLAAMIRQQGFPGVQTDYIMYLYDRKPGT